MRSNRKVAKKTKTLNNDNEEDYQSISLPLDIISVILTRLPIKPLLQFRSVSKQWLSLISSHSFAKHHQHRSTSLLITTYDTSTRLRHILSVPRATSTTSRAAARVTHLITLHDTPFMILENSALEHLHGLVLFTTGNGYNENNSAIVINPSTRKYLKLNPPDSVYDHGKVHAACFFFGYDEIRNEHKVLYLRILDMKSLRPFEPSVEIMLYELSSFTWRKIDVDLPFDISDNARWYYGSRKSVCVNSAIHVMLWSRYEVLVFDLRREVFEIIKIPNEALPVEMHSCYDCKGTRTVKFNQPSLMKVNGFLGVVCHDRVVKTNEMDIWMLKDYVEHVWVKETIVFGESWAQLEAPFPSDCINVDEIAFTPKSVSRDLIKIPIYDMKTKSFRSVKYFLGEQFLRAKTVKFNQIKSYVDSMLPLEMNATSTS